jgi:hypothetical protein
VTDEMRDREPPREWNEKHEWGLVFLLPYGSTGLRIKRPVPFWPVPHQTGARDMWGREYVGLISHTDWAGIPTEIGSSKGALRPAMKTQGRPISTTYLGYLISSWASW